MRRIFSATTGSMAARQPTTYRHDGDCTLSLSSSHEVLEVTSDLIAKYVDERQRENARNATINREMSALKRMFRIGMYATPPKVLRLPKFPKLAEDNIRKGFLEDAQYKKLIANCPDLWFRALVDGA